MVHDEKKTLLQIKVLIQKCKCKISVLQRSINNFPVIIRRSLVRFRSN